MEKKSSEQQPPRLVMAELQKLTAKQMEEMFQKLTGRPFSPEGRTRAQRLAKEFEESPPENPFADTNAENDDLGSIRGMPGQAANDSEMM